LFSDLPDLTPLRGGTGMQVRCNTCLENEALVGGFKKDPLIAKGSTKGVKGQARAR